MKRLGIRLCAVLILASGPTACRKPVDLEQHYREGDRLAAIDAWEQIPPDDPRYTAAQARVQDLEAEVAALVQEYTIQGKAAESENRLTKAIESYRLVLELDPHARDGDFTLEQRVQDLARQRAERKAETLEAFRQADAAGDLAQAWAALEALGTLDDLDPEIEAEQDRLDIERSGAIERHLSQGRSQLPGDLDGAQDEFETVLTLDRHNRSAQGYLEWIEILRGHEDNWPTHFELTVESDAAHRAARDYMAALDANPAYVRALRRGRDEKVEELIEKGRRKYHEEDLGGALGEWEKALRIDPDNERGLEYRERANRLVENLEKLRPDTDTETR